MKALILYYNEEDNELAVESAGSPDDAAVFTPLSPEDVDNLREILDDCGIKYAYNVKYKGD